MKKVLLLFLSALPFFGQAEINPPVKKSFEGTMKSAIQSVTLKTDLMLWAGVMPNFQMGTWTPNLSAEIHFARRWSAQFGWAYANWNSYTKNKQLFAVSAFDLEGRYWLLSNNRYEGFFSDVNFQFGDYDKQEKLTGQTGRFWGVGIGVGYLLPLSNRWGIETQARLGYRSATNNEYEIETQHNYFNKNQTDRKFNVQLRLLVVYRFGKSIK